MTVGAMRRARWLRRRAVRTVEERLDRAGRVLLVVVVGQRELAGPTGRARGRRRLGGGIVRGLGHARQG